jgi:hypothetical protein
MTGQSVHYIKDLSARDIEALTQLLSLGPGSSPTSEWLRDQLHLLSTFPATLKRPSAILPRIAMALPFSPPRALLCPTHKLLNSHLVRSIFLLVSAECTVRLTRLVKNSLLPPKLSSFVKRLHKVNSLWMSPELYRVGFGALPGDPRYDRISSGCEACILAAVGGNQAVLCDLRASMIGRKKKRHPTPRLLPIVEAWIDWTGRSDALRQESEDLGREVRQCRRQMQLARRQLARNVSDGIVNRSFGTESGALLEEENTEPFETERGEENADNEDFEDSIIDFYANLMSTTNFTPDHYPESIHPAFRDSMLFSPATGTFHRTGPAPNGPKSAYSESVYSNAGVPSIQNSEAGLKGRTPREVANEYRALVGIEEENENQNESSRGRRTGREESSPDRMTRWSDFQG